MYEKYDIATIRMAEILADLALTSDLETENRREEEKIRDNILDALDGCDNLGEACRVVDCLGDLALNCEDEEKAGRMYALIDWAYDVIYDCDWEDPCPDLPAPHEVARWQAEESRTDYDY